MLSEEVFSNDGFPRILVVDDDQLVADSLGKVLKNENFQVKVANNGLEAVNMLKYEDVDLIICDIMMPEMDGYQFQNELNKHLNLQNIPFIFLSACDDSESKMKGVEAGADAYLNKPCDVNELIATVRGRMKRSQARSQHLSQEKEQFSNEIIRHLSHEFRTPLLAVNGGSEILSDQFEDLSKDNVGTLIKSIRRGGKRLECLVNNFILMQQIQSGQAEKYYYRHCQVFDIEQFIGEYIRLKGQELASEGYKFENNFSVPSDVDLKACPNQLVQILDRLFDNAKKFDQENRKIVFRANTNDSFLVLSLEDSGNGFDSDSIGDITSTFYQHDRKKNEQQGGGLGLSICQLLTAVNRGQLEFANTKQGGQARLVFPLKK